MTFSLQSIGDQTIKFFIFKFIFTNCVLSRLFIQFFSVQLIWKSNSYILLIYYFKFYYLLTVLGIFYLIQPSQNLMVYILLFFIQRCILSFFYRLLLAIDRFLHFCFFEADWFLRFGSTFIEHLILLLLIRGPNGGTTLTLTRRARKRR